MRNLLRILWATVLAVCLNAYVAAIADDDSERSAKEYQVKAVFLYSFVKFVEWPGEQALQKTHAANICIVGENPFGSALDVFKQAQASSPQLALNVKLDVSDRDLQGCHIAFISSSEESRIPSILAATRSLPVLTVSESKGFADSGGIIEMVKVEKTIGLFSKDKINLRINSKAAEAKGLKLDGDLLGIAAEVIK